MRKGEYCLSVKILQAHIHKTAVYTECIRNISLDQNCSNIGHDFNTENSDVLALSSWGG